MCTHTHTRTKLFDSRFCFCFSVLFAAANIVAIIKAVLAPCNRDIAANTELKIFGAKNNENSELLVLNRKWVCRRVKTEENKKFIQIEIVSEVWCKCLWMCMRVCVIVSVVDETRLVCVSHQMPYPPVWVCASIYPYHPKDATIFFKYRNPREDRKYSEPFSMKFDGNASIGGCVYAFGINQPQTKLYAHIYWAKRNINTSELCYFFFSMKEEEHEPKLPNLKYANRTVNRTEPNWKTTNEKKK